MEKSASIQWEIEEETVCIQLVKKSLKLNEKMRKKTRDSIDAKLLKLNEKTRKKTNHSFVESEKSPKPS